MGIGYQVEERMNRGGKRWTEAGKHQIEKGNVDRAAVFGILPCCSVSGGGSGGHITSLLDRIDGKCGAIYPTNYAGEHLSESGKKSAQAERKWKRR